MSGEPIAIMYDQILSELRERFRVLRSKGESWYNPKSGYDFDEADIERWARLGGMSKMGVFDLLATELARDFEGGFLGYEFCSWAANGLNLVHTPMDIEVAPEGEPAWVFIAFYRAFDGSEMGTLEQARKTARANIQAFLADL